MEKKSETPHENLVLTIAEVARYLRVHPSTIYRLVKSNDLPAFKLGGDWRFNIEDLDALRFGLARREPKRDGAKRRGKLQHLHRYW